MLGLSNGLMQGSVISSGPQVFTYASMFMYNTMSYPEWGGTTYGFNPCNQNLIAVNPTGGLPDNDNYVLVAWIGGTFSDTCRAWTGNLLSASDLDGGIQDSDVITLSYEMWIGAGSTQAQANSKWSPGDGSAVPIDTTISGFNAVSTNFTPQVNPNPSYTAVNIEVTKSGGTQNEGLTVTIGPFDQQLSNASAQIRKINATVNRPG